MTFAELQQLARRVGLRCEQHASGIRIRDASGVIVAHHLSASDACTIVVARHDFHLSAELRHYAKINSGWAGAAM